MNRLINCSLDTLHLYTYHHIELPRIDLENHFPVLVAQEIKKNKPENIYVINWPGSFTNLRIWTLSANTANMVSDYQIKLYTISKIELYQAWYKNWWPSKFLIWIGQRKNWWLYDCVIWSYETISDISLLNLENIAVDWIAIYEDKGKQISIEHFEDEIELWFEWNSVKIWYADLPFVKEHLLQPNYMMNPNIG